MKTVNGRIRLLSTSFPVKIQEQYERLTLGDECLLLRQDLSRIPNQGHSSLRKRPAEKQNQPFKLTLVLL